MADTQGVILAGGISSRMGFPKALMPVGQDSFFLLSIYRMMVAAGATPVHMVINSGLRFSLEAQIGKFPEGKLVLNQEPAKGQIHSLKIGLGEAAADGAKAALVTLVDLPLVKPDTAAAIVLKGEQAPGKIIVPRVGSEHGHPFLVPREKFAAFIEAPEGKTARDILHDHADAVEYLDVEDRGVLQDIDTLEDLAKFQAQDDELD